MSLQKSEMKNDCLLTIASNLNEMQKAGSPLRITDFPTQPPYYLPAKGRSERLLSI